MQSYYELSKSEIRKLEFEFRSLSLGKYAHQIWIINNVLGVFLASCSAIYFVFQGIRQVSFSSLDLFFFSFLLLGYFLVYSATKEYYRKYYSWLRVQKNIIAE